MFRPLVLSLAVLAGVGIGWAALGNSASARLERARTLAFEGRVVEAAAEYQGLLVTLDPSRRREAWIEATVRLAELVHLELKDPQRALDLYRELVREFPDAEESWQARERIAWIALKHLHDRHEAISQWQELALSGRPDADKWALEVARAYFKLRDYEQVRRECAALAERSPSGEHTGEALLLAATSLQLENRHEEAIAAFEEVAKRFPESEVEAQARYQIGLSLAALREWDGAMAALVASLENHPDPWRVQAEITRVRRHAAEARKIQPTRTFAETR